MGRDFIGFVITLLGLAWAFHTVKLWWSSRKVNQISEEEKGLIKEALKNENEIKKISDNIQSIPAQQEGKTDKQIEDFWNGKK